MANDTVLWEVDGRGVATVTLNRPEVNNAYNGELIQGLLAALDALGGAHGLRAVVIKGNGKHFQIAADNATFSIAEVRWGLTAAIIVPQLNDAIGVRQLRRYGLTGERFNAAEARRIGLVHEVVLLAE